MYTRMCMCVVALNNAFQFRFEAQKPRLSSMEFINSPVVVVQCVCMRAAFSQSCATGVVICFVFSLSLFFRERYCSNIIMKYVWNTGWRWKLWECEYVTELDIWLRLLGCSPDATQTQALALALSVHMFEILLLKID